jgi:predicted acylesterase/phospholipase RssA
MNNILIDQLLATQFFQTIWSGFKCCSSGLFLKQGIKNIIVFSFGICICGCAIFPLGTSTNKEMVNSLPLPSSQTSFVLREKRQIPEGCRSQNIESPKKSNSFVALSLSGGGSRAAYFSALIMLELENIKINLSQSGEGTDILHEVDIISTVSGGSLAGAYYAISYDSGQECSTVSDRIWNKEVVTELMARDYRTKWIGNWFWPSNVIRYWLTDYDRTDIMAQTLSDNLFDTKWSGDDLALSELNPLRPNLILNATVGSRGQSGNPDSLQFGDIFTFSEEDFRKIKSSVGDYSVGRAVMATATFPGVFNFMTLTDYASSEDNRRYLHLLDGGNSDNLGLTSIKRSLLEMTTDNKINNYKNCIVILVDAFIGSAGVSPEKSEPRNLLDYIVDTNFLEAADSLLEKNRAEILSSFKNDNTSLFPFDAEDTCYKFFSGSDRKKFCNKSVDYWKKMSADVKSKLYFAHISFDKIIENKDKTPARIWCKCHGNLDNCKLWKQLNGIKTDFNIDNNVPDDNTGLTDSQAIECAVPILFGRVDQTACGSLKNLTPSMTMKKEIDEIVHRIGNQREAVGH